MKLIPLIGLGLFIGISQAQAACPNYSVIKDFFDFGDRNNFWPSGRWQFDITDQTNCVGRFLASLDSNGDSEGRLQIHFNMNEIIATFGGGSGIGSLLVFTCKGATACIREEQYGESRLRKRSEIGYLL